MMPPVDISNTELRTERLLLRPWRESDLEDLFEYASVEGVGENAGWLPHENREQSREVLNKFIAGRKTFAIEYEGKVVGSLGIEKYQEAMFPEYDGLRCRELGFVLAKPYWGRGLMPEAVNAVLGWLFFDQAYDAVFCGNFVHNAQSARVQEKCGFRPVGLILHQTHYGAVFETQLRVITKDEFIGLHGLPEG